MTDARVRLASSRLFSSDDLEGDVERFLLAAAPDRTIALPTTRPNGADDGTIVWCYGATDATADWSLIGIDLRTDEIRDVASTEPDAPLPAIDPATGAAAIVIDDELVAFSPGSAFEPERLAEIRIDAAIPSDIAAGVSRSADGDRFGLLVGGETRRLVAVHVATGDTDVWHSDAVGCTTVRFSPTDPTVTLFARESPRSGERSGRAAAWLAREGLGARPLTDLLPDRHRGYWWAPDGGGLWYVEPGAAVSYLDLELGSRRTEWSVPARSAHGTRDGSLLAATVVNGDRTRLRVTDGSSTIDVETCADGSWRPRPTFVGGDAYLAYTSVARNRPALALVPVSTLREQL